MLMNFSNYSCVEIKTWVARDNFVLFFRNRGNNYARKIVPM